MLKDVDVEDCELVDTLDMDVEVTLSLMDSVTEVSLAVDDEILDSVPEVSLAVAVTAPVDRNKTRAAGFS